jgi:hypothetical protein
MFIFVRPLGVRQSPPKAAGYHICSLLTKHLDTGVTKNTASCFIMQLPRSKLHNLPATKVPFNMLGVKRND